MRVKRSHEPARGLTGCSHFRTPVLDCATSRAPDMMYRNAVTSVCSFMRALIETVGGLWCLMRLAIQSRFRLRGPYWRWRMETAFGHQPERSPSRWTRWRAVIDYGRWVYRMRRSLK